MPDDFGSVTVTPPAAPVRDKRRIKTLVVRMNGAVPAIEAVAAVTEVIGVEAVAAVAAVEADEEAGIEAVAAVEAVEPVEAVAAVVEVVAVAAVPAGIRVAEIEIQYTNFSSTNEKTAANPGGVLSQDGANLYKDAKADAIKSAIFKPGAKAEIESRLAEDNIDA